MDGAAELVMTSGKENTVLKSNRSDDINDKEFVMI